MSGISAFTLAAATGADLLFGSSSKKVNGATDELEQGREQLLDFASRMIASQPPETQKELVGKASEYLVHQQGLRMIDVDAPKLAADIMEHISHYPKVPLQLSAHLS